MLKIITLFMIFGSSAWASSTRVVTADSLISSSGSLTFSLPATTDTLAGIAATQTLTNKTLTSPTINGAAMSGTVTGTPTFSGAITLSGGPTISGSGSITDAVSIVNASTTTKKLVHNLSGMTASVTLTLSSSQSTSQTLTIPNITAADTLVSQAFTQTLTNKTISGASNTFSNLPVETQFQQDVFYGNGTSTTFTLSFTQVAAAGLMCHLNGSSLIQGSSNDYTVSGTTLTMNTAPATGQTVLCIYSKY